ncbi:unnamed protein product [Nippostrongylus brasiliensis]|uniref:RING-type E3 ubiquitin transferase n=1 Tax=Nippostrongylus brasiliensis TaxID=27835 RepID=A0A0N4YIK5_NIPBR|nr:unnamed protein product [Nippostrongylus brasiliensis]
MDATCIICRDEMTPESTPKRLPCGHVFHTHCLRSWFQRQQTCPTCRTDILAAAGQRVAANGPQPAAPVNNVNVPGQNGVINARLPPNLFPFMAHQFAVPQPRPPAQDNTAPPAAAEGEARAPDTGAFAFQRGAPPVGFPQGMFPFPYPMPQDMPHLPTFPFLAPIPPFPMEMPRPPPQLDQLSEEDLRAMEGQSRAALERRVKMLQDISTLLDAAIAQMQQYTAVFGTLTDQKLMTNSQSGILVQRDVRKRRVGRECSLSCVSLNF